jgi:hypothetical protein
MIPPWTSCTWLAFGLFANQMGPIQLFWLQTPRPHLYNATLVASWQAAVGPQVQVEASSLKGIMQQLDDLREDGRVAAAQKCEVQACSSRHGQQLQIM